MSAKGEIVIYKAPDGATAVNVRLQEETVWLAQKDIADLFGTQRPAITKHLANIFKSRELNENSVNSILEHTAAERKVYQTKFYNLDAIISIGYPLREQNIERLLSLLPDFRISSLMQNSKDDDMIFVNPEKYVVREFLQAGFPDAFMPHLKLLRIVMNPLQQQVKHFNKQQS